MKLNLGGNEELDGGPGSQPLTGFTHVDIRQISGVELVCDVSKRIPLEDGVVEEIRASHIIEHIIKGDRGDGIPNIKSDDDTFITPGKKQTSISLYASCSL